MFGLKWLYSDQLRLSKSNKDQSVVIRDKIKTMILEDKYQSDNEEDQDDPSSNTPILMEAESKWIVLQFVQLFVLLIVFITYCWITSLINITSYTKL